MACEKRPSFPFYPKDWLGSASVSAMPLDAQGLYVRLLSFAWLSDGLPAEADALRRLAGVERAAWRKLWPHVEPLWTLAGNRLQNVKLERVREEASAYSEARALAGHKGGISRSKRQANGKQTASTCEATAQANDVAKTKPSSSSSSSITECVPNGTHSVVRAPARTGADDGYLGDPGGMPTRRRKAHCAWESSRGLDVPQALHDELLGRLGTGDEAALRAWYAETERTWQGRAVGDDCWRFWRARFREWQAPEAKASSLDGWADGLAAEAAR
jgi:uncharacterized protein YdaU (DUF1376 family)